MKILKIQSLRIFFIEIESFFGRVDSVILAHPISRLMEATIPSPSGCYQWRYPPQIGLGALQDVLELGVKGFADISPCSRATAHFRSRPPSPVTLLTTDLATVAKRRMTSRSCSSATTDPNTTRIELGTLQTMPNKVLGSDLQELEIRHFSFKS